MINKGYTYTWSKMTTLDSLAQQTLDPTIPITLLVLLLIFAMAHCKAENYES